MWSKNVLLMLEELLSGRRLSLSFAAFVIKENETATKEFLTGSKSELEHLDPEMETLMLQEEASGREYVKLSKKDALFVNYTGKLSFLNPSSSLGHNLPNYADICAPLSLYTLVASFPTVREGANRTLSDARERRAAFVPALRRV